MTIRPRPFNAQERDIDIMLVEEMYCTPAFVSWIAVRAGLESATLVWARQGVFDAEGETDVLAMLDTAGGHVALMIEDKIGAAMQPRQAERYHERGQRLCAAEPATTAYRTLLFAPSAYLSATTSMLWHATLSFEEVADWFGEQRDPRAVWKRDVLLGAINRQRRSAENALGSASDPDLDNFKQAYRNFIIDNYPEFKASNPKVGSLEKDYFFRARTLPPYMNFKHRFSRSKIVICFEERWKERAAALFLNQVLDNSLEVAFHPSALHLAIEVEPIDFKAPFGDQADLIAIAMEAARRLLPYAMMVQRAASEPLSATTPEEPCF